MRRTRQLLFIFMAAINILSQTALRSQPSSSTENNQTRSGLQQYVYGENSLIDPPGAVTGMSSFFDYQTNGNNQRNIFVLGDTMIVCWTKSDSTDPLGFTTRKAVYNISFNAGNTWEPQAIIITPGRSSYPSLNLLLGGAIGRNVAISGRTYIPGVRGAVWVDAFLGLGSFTESVVEGSDIISCSTNDVNLACAYISSDTLKFRIFLSASYTFTQPTILISGPTQVNGTLRPHVASNLSYNVMVAMWDSVSIGRLRYRESTDGGINFNSIATISSSGQVVNGDAISPYLSADIIYKPYTLTKCAAWPTRAASGSMNQAGSKLLFWSNDINSGNPTVIADRTNFPNLTNAASIGNLKGLQVGVTPVSHPSLAFSADGMRIFCAYSGFQTDTLNGFNFNDIYLSYSDNGGLNWSSPMNVTNTPDWDELYPTISETGNTRSTINIVYQYTKGPGSQSFQNNAPVYRVWQVHKKITNIPTGINGSTEIPSEFSLHQNFPNPFNPATIIKFDLPAKEMVSLKLYDASGRLVKNLINNKVINAGTNEVTLNADGLSSGIYYYTLTAGQNSQTKKLILLK